MARAPQIKGTVDWFDEAALRAMPGVIDGGGNPTGVAIIAETFGRALDTQEAMKACYSKWEEP